MQGEELNLVLLVLEWIVSLFLCGLIWTVQLVHYPSFRYISKDKFVHFEHFHQKSISSLVVPFMILEICLSFYNLITRIEGFIYFSSFLALLLIWFSTFFLSVPIHSKLQEGHNSENIEKLIKTNWPRTILWTLRSLLLGSILMKG